MKLGPRRNYHKVRAAIRHYANQSGPSRGLLCDCTTSQINRLQHQFELLRFLPDHQFVAFPAAALVFIWQIQAAGKSHFPAGWLHFVGDIAMNVGWVAGMV